MEELYKVLKQRFSESPEYKGYDADEEPGYFQEFLVGEVGRLEKALEECRAECKRVKFRLNHQTEDDVWECTHGLHGSDCGK